MCRFLDIDGHCAFHSDKEVKEYCVAGPCPDYQNYDELIKALRCGTVKGDGKLNCPVCNYSHGDCCWTLIMLDAADEIERLMAEVVRKDKALQAWAKTWESRKENAIRHICDHCDTPIEVRLKEGACEDCPIITLVKEIFDEQPT